MKRLQQIIGRLITCPLPYFGSQVIVGNDQKENFDWKLGYIMTNYCQNLAANDNFMAKLNEWKLVFA